MCPSTRASCDIRRTTGEKGEGNQTKYMASCPLVLGEEDLNWRMPTIKRRRGTASWPMRVVIVGGRGQLTEEGHG